MDPEMIEVELPASAPAAVVADAEADGGLQSPPESNNALNDGSDSELSELGDDPEEEDIGDVFPDHVENGVPVFMPQMAQFKSFKAYMAKVNNYGMQSGIVKVIPPPEWHAQLPPLDEAIKTIRVKEPIKQDIMGTSGTYRQANIVHQRSYNLPQWRQLCEQSEHQPPAKRGERRANQEQAARPGFRPKNQSATGKRKSARSTKATPKKKTKTEKEDTPDRLPTPVSPAMKPDDDMESLRLEDTDDDEGTPKPKGGRQPKATTVGARRKYNRREAAGKVDEEAFKDFKYQLEGQDFSPERCEELERAYWKTLTYAPPLYGADMPGSLFDDRTEAWNLGKLENLLDVMGTKIPGVNTAYLYLGMWKATFAWHLEDVDLYSINIVHFGAPKQWYSIAQKDARRFEAAMKSIFPTDAKACDQFLRHKTFLISPAHLLQNYGIRVNKIVAHPGEFVITFPYGYHSGYNLGYNCAEAVNFALDSWLEFGRVAKKCDCSQAQDSVWIDVREIERKLRGEETEYEETDDEMEEEDEEDEPTDLPTPPDSSGDNKVKAPKKKRKRPVDDRGGQTEVKRIRVRVKFPIREPCILCPNDTPSEPLIPTDDGRRAHRICAQYIPETSIEEGEKEMAVDIKYIDKARLELKCNYCRSKKGACFQCSQKKCTRAYHATCAAAAGVFVEEGEIPVFGEDGTEYKDHAIEFSCRFHRSKRDKRLDIDTLSQDPKIIQAASELAVGAVCQMQFFRQDIFAGVLVENRKGEEILLVDLLPKGHRIEVPYGWLLVPDPSDYRLPKPSANAIALPKTRKEKMDLNTTKRLADDLPRTDDLFGAGFTWAEFKAEDIPKNLAQVKIDFGKENQIWYYLGKTSTEAKAQFTEDPRKPRHNPKGHFLDTIPKAVLPAPRQSYGATYPAKINYHALNASKANRPSPLHHTQTSRPEKPYEYKPRQPSDAYRIDPLAYRSQQSFLQQSASSFTVPKPTGYTFGTDPRYQQHNVNAASYPGYVNKAAQGTVNALMAPPVQYHTSQMPKSNNPFTSRPQSASNNPRQASRPSPFSKYPYLQREHNRSPLEYKSPYRPGGGFMNGYQGSLKEHLQQTMFQNRSSSGIPLMPNPLSKVQQAATSYQPLYAPYAQNRPTASQGQMDYNAYLKSADQKAAAQQVWEKKNNAQLHPAIRQEYGSMFHQQYQPSQQPHAQGQQKISQGPTGQAQPAQDARYIQDSRQILHAPQPRYSGPLAPPPSSYAPPYNPDLLNMSIPPPTNRYPYPYPNIPQPPIPALTPQPKNRYQPPPRPSSKDKDETSVDGENKLADQPVWVPPSQRYQEYVQQESEQAQPAENRPAYHHQQFFQKAQGGKPVIQKPATKAPTPLQPDSSMVQTLATQKPGLDGGAVVPYEKNTERSASQPRDFPDVPVDSTSLVEKMILNLKKATAGSPSQ